MDADTRVWLGIEFHDPEVPPNERGVGIVQPAGTSGLIEKDDEEDVYSPEAPDDGMVVVRWPAVLGSGYSHPTWEYLAELVEIPE